MRSWRAIYAVNNKVQLEYDVAREAVRKLRKLDCDPNVPAHLVNIAAEMWVSLLKYHIYDAVDKSYVRQKIERLVHLHQVDEIPGLLSALRLNQP